MVGLVALGGSGILVACPRDILQNPGFPSELLKFAINRQLSSFFHFGVKLQLDPKINHYVTVSPPKICEPATVQNPTHFILSSEG